MDLEMANFAPQAGKQPERSTMTRISGPLRESIEQAGQLSVLRFWDELSPAERTEFSQQLSSVDWSVVRRRREQCLNPQAEQKLVRGRIDPPSRLIRRPQTAAELSDWQTAQQAGRQMLDRGQVGVLLVAGGAGTRLGFHHPKGMFPIGPVSNRSLYQLFAEQVLALSRRHEVAIPFMIMTGDSTHDESVSWFERHRWFGLDPANVFFFRQGWQPALEVATGDLLLETKSALAVSPDGHGGLLQAMLQADLFGELRRRRVETLFYHQVDNPLVHVCDPAFLGFHARHAAQVSTKVVPKCEPEEKVGVVVEIDGRVQIIEYIDLPRELSVARDPDGQLRFRAGNTAIHLFQRDFLERIAVEHGGLPWHQVRRKVSCIDACGRVVQPEQPNALKFERFIFDVLPIAETALVFETDRAMEFAPLKNAEGDCSPCEVRQAMIAVAAQRLRDVGIDVPAGHPIEISPLAVLPDESLALSPDVCLPAVEPWIIGPEQVAPTLASNAGIEPPASSAMGPLLFDTRLMSRVWGGRALGDILGHTLSTPGPYGEAWDISVLDNEVSQVSEGPLRGMTLTKLWAERGRDLCGKQTVPGVPFPVLIKWLECRERLSLQVHPNDAMARQILNQPYGKSEAWIVLEADATARVLAGLKPGVTQADLVRCLESGQVEDCIHSFTPKRGDCILLPAGTIHAAGGGVLIAEIQQSSDSTFRLHDWNRPGLDGRPRPLQIDLALQAIDWTQGPISPIPPGTAVAIADGVQAEFLAELHAFSMTRYSITRPWTMSSGDELALWMVLEGSIGLTHTLTGEQQQIRRGRTVLLPASIGQVVWSPLTVADPVTVLQIRLP